MLKFIRIYYLNFSDRYTKNVKIKCLYKEDKSTMYIFITS